MARIVKRWRVTRLGADGSRTERADSLAGEEPLEIRIHGESFSVTMRTPGSDVDLVAGFLVSEGILWRADQLHQMSYDGSVNARGERDYNVLDVHLAHGVAGPDVTMARHVYTTSSCGVCGTASIEAVRKTSAYSMAGDTTTFDLTHLTGLPEALRREQAVFDRTGGVHAAAIFTAAATAAEPNLVCLREDVGRHNAVDKVVGWALQQDRLPLRGTVLQVSGRASFELVQKAAMAGIPVLSAVSAPSALAVELADELGLTLIGFNRNGTLNAYTGIERINAGG